jgi:hypothetical protein
MYEPCVCTVAERLHMYPSGAVYHLPTCRQYVPKAERPPNDLQDKREGEVTAGAAQREGPKEIQCSVYGIDSSAFDQ